MRNAKQWSVRLCAAVLTAALAWPRCVMAAAPVVDQGEAALAERLLDTARLTLSSRYLTDAHYRMAGALLEGATTLVPTEPRYSRLWADAALQARDRFGQIDRDNAIRALKAYLKVSPEDHSALIQLSDLQAGAYETMDKRLGYLLDWIDDTRLPEDVRSHLAFLAYQVYFERAQIPQSKAVLEKAYKLNPLSMDVLRVRLELATSAGTPYDRIAVLLQILKSNPAQVGSMQRLGVELAAVGLMQPSLQFFSLSFNLSNRMGTSIAPEAVVAYAAELILINQAANAKPLVDQLVAARPSDYEVVALRLMIERATDQKEDAAKTLHQLHNIVLNRLQVLRKEALNQAGATTRPVESPAELDWGALDADIKQIKEMKKEDGDALRSKYGAVLAEAAWLEIYFREAPGDAKPFVDALRQLVPDDDMTLARLEGWSFLFKGDKQPAFVKLSAVRERDPLAELGLIRMMDPASSKSEGDKFLAKHPLGLTGLIIADALRDRKVALVPNTEAVVPIVDMLNKFEAAWMTVLDQPQSFYSITAEPMRQAIEFGDPMLLRVTIKNVSNYPITVGPEGTLHADLWFEAEFRGVVKQNIPFAAYDRIHAVVIQPHTSVVQIVRVDQGQMLQFLTTSPFPAMQVVMKVRTNPSTTAQNGLAPGGQLVQASKAFDRQSFSYAPASLQTLVKQMQTETPGVKICKIDLAATVALVLSQQPTEEGKRTAQTLIELLKSSQRDASPNVAIWGSATIARFSASNERPQMVGRLVNDPNWVARLLGLSSMGPIRMEDQRTIAEQMAAKDADKIVVGYAKALDELLGMAIAAAAQAATQPSATQPATAGATTQGTTPEGPSTLTPFPNMTPTTRPAGSTGPIDNVDLRGMVNSPTTKPAAGPVVIPDLNVPQDNK